MIFISQTVRAHPNVDLKKKKVEVFSLAHAFMLILREEGFTAKNQSKKGISSTRAPLLSNIGPYRNFFLKVHIFMD